jgi:hypothetical protein
MAAWSPSDLTNPSFVKTQLSDKDRSNALFTTTNELKSAEVRLKQQEAALLVAQAAQNNGPGRGQINELKAKSTDPSLTAAERTQAAEQAAALSDQRDKNNVAAANALEKFNSTNQYVNDLTVGQSNLLAVGTVPPGVSSFAAFPGYDGRNSPAQEVPSSQNPTATPTTTTEELQSASPALINPNSDPNTNIGAEIQDTGFELLQEPPATTDGDEFSGIDEQIQRQRDLEDGSLEFAGIDQQIAANENTLQEPPQLSDEEVTAYLQNLPSNEYDITNVESENPGVFRGTTGPLAETRGAATSQDASNFQQKQDWRVRLSLAPGSTYLYNNTGNEGILLPLAQTKGVIFPYTPAISVAYTASYDPNELTHSNYKFFSYRASAVDSISITCDFTAQDTFEANYLLAVIHFFRSVTKMFYGQDQNPKPGTPPPLCYLTGLGAFQFDDHPLAITGFTYSLPTDVDYIRAGVPTTQPGVNKAPAIPPTGIFGATNSRLQSSGLQPGALAPPVYFTENAGTREPTYVPTKIQMAITAVPIVTRNDISNTFSLKEYGTGKLLRGSKRSGGGIW